MLIPSPFATKEDLAARWRTLTPDEQSRATILLGDASSQIVDEYPNANVVPDADTVALETRTATLKRITCEMVKRAMISDTTGDEPSITEASQSAGPFAFRTKLTNPTGDLYMIKSERRAFMRQTAFTVSMSPDDDVPVVLDSDLS